MRRVLTFAGPTLLPMVVASIVLSAGGWAGAASRGDPGSYRVLAGPYSRKDARAGVGTPVARQKLGGLSISVEFLEPAARAAFVKSLSSKDGDPFAVRPGRPERFSAFRVSFDNGTVSDVQFQAGNVVLITDGKSQDFPVDLTDLYRLAAEAGTPDPEGAIDRVAPVLFDGSTTIRKGARVERLLVFGPFPEKWKDVQLHFSYLQIGTDTRTVSFQFHKGSRKE